MFQFTRDVRFRLFLLILITSLSISHSIQSAPISQKIKIKADTVQADFKHNIITAKGHIHIQDQTYTLTAKNAKVDDHHQTIELSGAVHVTQTNSTFTLNCQYLLADKKANTMIAKDQVSLKLDDITAQSQEATYYLNKNIVVLSGEPIAWKNDNKIEGKEIMIDVEHKRIKSNGKTKIIISEDTIPQ